MGLKPIKLSPAWREVDRLQAELDQAICVRKELISNVSHELRTPITAILAQSENLVDGVTPMTKASATLIYDQANRLNRLISYLLDLSRVEAGTANLNVEEHEVGDWLEQVLDPLTMLEPAKDLSFNIDVTPIDLKARFDSDRMEQAISNLISNAITHSPTGGLVRIIAHQNEQGELVLDVTDEGPGVADADKERIFGRFKQAAVGKDGKAGTSAVSGGTGIGLAIVRWAVELHRGEVRVIPAESAVQSGATFEVSIPQ